MVHRKSTMKKSGTQRLKRRVSQLQLPFEKSFRKKVNGRTKPKNKTLRKIIFVLNCILSTILLFMVFAELKPKTQETLPNLQMEKYPVVSQRKEYTAKQEEKAFLKTALNHDEDDEYRLFQLENGLLKNTLEIEDVSPILPNEIVTRVDDIKLTNEEVYKLYEEKIPEDIVIPEKTPAEKTSLPMIAIVIDDMGISVSRTRDIASLKYPINASFLTYAKNLKGQISLAKASGQEIMAHLPMEPQVMQNFTPTMLTTKMNDEELLSTLRNMLEAIPEAKHVNNHMGSRITEDKHRMAVVMKELAARKIGFLDSKTTPHSAAPEQARRFGIDLTMRNVFLDNKDDFDYITKQLKQTEEIARKRGYAIAIGHPKAQTYQALKAWLPTVKDKGFRLVKISELSEYINKKSKK